MKLQDEECFSLLGNVKAPWNSDNVVSQKSFTEKTDTKGLPWWSGGQDSAPNAGGLCSIPGEGTRSHRLQLQISCAVTDIWHSQINN